MKTGTSKMLNLMGLKIQGDLGPITCYTNKRDRVVWFIKAPPKSPPTDEQIWMRDKFRAIAIAWWALTDEQRITWLSTMDKAHLRITGYNVFTYWKWTGDDAAIATIARHADISLPP